MYLNALCSVNKELNLIENLNSTKHDVTLFLTIDKVSY